MRCTASSSGRMSSEREYTTKSVLFQTLLHVGYGERRTAYAVRPPLCQAVSSQAVAATVVVIAAATVGTTAAEAVAAAEKDQDNDEELLFIEYSGQALKYGL